MYVHARLAVARSALLLLLPPRVQVYVARDASFTLLEQLLLPPRVQVYVARDASFTLLEQLLLPPRVQVYVARDASGKEPACRCPRASREQQSVHATASVLTRA